MKGVTFGRYHSYNDFNLILTGKEIGSAVVKTNYVDVDGAHGHIDYTEYFGEPKYSSRSLSFKFNTIVNQFEFLTLYSKIQDALHGKRMKIVLDDDSGYYYMGRIEVSAFTNDKNIGQISIDCTCEPWKYRKDKTVITKDVSSSATITLVNSRKKVVPSITTTASMTIVYDGISTTVNAGTFTIPTLELAEGNNSVMVTGTGNITFTYQEGGL